MVIRIYEKHGELVEVDIQYDGEILANCDHDWLKPKILFVRRCQKCGGAKVT